MLAPPAPLLSSRSRAPVAASNVRIKVPCGRNTLTFMTLSTHLTCSNPQSKAYLTENKHPFQHGRPKPHIRFERTLVNGTVRNNLQMLGRLPFSSNKQTVRRVWSKEWNDLSLVLHACTPSWQQLKSQSFCFFHSCNITVCLPHLLLEKGKSPKVCKLFVLSHWK